MSDVPPLDIPVLAHEDEAPAPFAEEQEEDEDAESPIDATSAVCGLEKNDGGKVESPVRRPAIVRPVARNDRIDSPASTMSTSSMKSLHSFWCKSFLSIL